MGGIRQELLFFAQRFKQPLQDSKLWEGWNEIICKSYKNWKQERFQFAWEGGRGSEASWQPRDKGEDHDNLKMSIRIAHLLFCVFLILAITYIYVVRITAKPTKRSIYN